MNNYYGIFFKEDKIISYFEKFITGNGSNKIKTVVNSFISGSIFKKLEKNISSMEEINTYKSLKSIFEILNQDDEVKRKALLSLKILKLTSTNKKYYDQKELKYDKDFEIIFKILVNKESIFLLKKLLSDYILPDSFKSIEKVSSDEKKELLNFIYENRAYLVNKKVFEEKVIPKNFLNKKTLLDFDYYRMCLFINENKFLLMDKIEYEKMKKIYILPEEFNDLEDLDEDEYIESVEYIRNNQEKLLSKEMYNSILKRSVFFKIRHIFFIGKVRKISKMNLEQYKKFVVEFEDNVLKVLENITFKKDMILKTINDMNMNKSFSNNKIFKLIEKKEKSVEKLYRVFYFWKDIMLEECTKDKKIFTKYYVSLAKYVRNYLTTILKSLSKEEIIKNSEIDIKIRSKILIYLNKLSKLIDELNEFVVKNSDKKYFSVETIIEEIV